MSNAELDRMFARVPDHDGLTVAARVLLMLHKYKEAK